MNEHLEGSEEVLVNDWGWDGPVEEYDKDYYFRPRDNVNYKPCQLPGVTSSVCVPRDDLKNDTQFCWEVNYPNICVPLKHFLWEEWTISEKDFVIEE